MAALRLRGADVTRAQEVGLAGSPDKVQLGWCRTDGRVLYSFNVGDFYGLHSDYLAAGEHHAGIILAPQQRYSVGEQMRRLLRLIAVRSAEDMRDRVEFLNEWGRP